ncbi:hypothetical protein NLJ89_g7702 [Agrocybe chaxingu]|uniref:Uncharacterized protein n=1 Tax=Agrocybe chaxingu TaxID=84603 RepID=A0A9W8MSV2_9AGAR|nr:hypothetical protein NLJ89_g7702 [Agrocybe chaxingu]
MTAFSDHRPQPAEGHSRIPEHSDVPKATYVHHGQDHSGTSPSAIRGETTPSSPTLSCRSRTLSVSSVSSFISSDTADDVDNSHIAVGSTSSPTIASRTPESPFDGQADRDSLPLNTCAGYVEGTAARAFEDQTTTSGIIGDAPADSRDSHVTNKDRPSRSD